MLARWLATRSDNYGICENGNLWRINGEARRENRFGFRLGRAYARRRGATRWNKYRGPFAQLRVVYDTARIVSGALRGIMDPPRINGERLDDFSS